MGDRRRRCRPSDEPWRSVAGDGAEIRGSARAPRRVPDRRVFPLSEYRKIGNTIFFFFFSRTYLYGSMIDVCRTIGVSPPFVVSTCSTRVKNVRVPRGARFRSDANSFPQKKKKKNKRPESGNPETSREIFKRNVEIRMAVYGCLFPRLLFVEHYFPNFQRSGGIFFWKITGTSRKDLHLNPTLNPI